MRVWMIMALILFSPLYSHTSVPLHKGVEKYLLAEKETDYKNRQKLFNACLSEYLKEESQHPFYQYNLGNCYFQLSEPALAAYHYLKALREAPRDEKIRHNLVESYKELGAIDKFNQKIRFEKFLLWPLASSYEKKWIWISLFGVTFILTSLTLWFRSQKLRISAFASLALLGIAFISYTYTQHKVKNEGLLISAYQMRCDAAEHYKPVSKEIIPAGSFVKVLDISPDGKWVKISEGGQKGFVPLEVVRVF